MKNIDTNKLKRDYILYPLIKTNRGSVVICEKPHKEDLEYLYIELNLSKKELMSYFKVANGTISKWLKDYKIKKDKILINTLREETNLKRIGVKYPMQSSVLKNKIIQTNLQRYGNEWSAQSKEIIQKVKKTKLERYGDENYVNPEKGALTKLEKYCDKTYNNREKMKQTFLNHYGVNHYSQTEGYKEKTRQTKLERYGNENYVNIDRMKKTCLEKYGVDNYSKTEEYKNRYKQTCLEKYGVDNYQKKDFSKETIKILYDKNNLIQFIKDNNIINCHQLAELLNISDSNACIYIRKYGLGYLMDYSKSIPEKEIRDYINQYYETENNIKLLDGKEIDIFIPEKNIGIEFNGDFYHNEYSKEIMYHQQKSSLAESKGIFLYHIFEYEWINNKDRIINQLNNLLGINTEKIYARNCIIKEVSNEEKNDFLNINHMQGNDISSVKLGLYYNNELVSIMTFVKPRFNKNYQYELSRFCSKAGCNVIGGASKLWKHFIKEYNPVSVISYSNVAHTKGNLYDMLEFKMINISRPNYVWCKGHQILSRYQCQKHKLLEQGYIGDSEVDIMHNRGYYRIYDCGNKVWIWRK